MTVPVRGVAAVFAVQTTVTLPFPIPDGCSTLIHATFDEPLQAHVGVEAAVTAIAIEPAAAPAVCEVGEIVNVHGTAAASWLRVNV